MKRFETLDGLRGVAALIVVAHHVSLHLGVVFLRSGYLAVDFFFMLSGFVLATVYEPRFRNGMTERQFSIIRLKSLYPTMAVGILLGALVCWIDGTKPMLLHTLILQLLFVPIPNGAFGLYPLNGVQWSLLFEFALNGLHVLIFWRLSNRNLALVCVAALGLLSFAAWQAGDFMLGDRGDNFFGGIPRAIFPYTLGILVYRWGLPSMKLPAWAFLAAFPLAILAADLAKRGVAGWVVDLALVALLFPALIHLGAQALSGSLRKACGALGLISFPLYAAHLPVIGAAILLGPLWAVGIAALAIIALSWASRSRQATAKCSTHTRGAVEALKQDATIPTASQVPR